MECVIDLIGEYSLNVVNKKDSIFTEKILRTYNDLIVTLFVKICLFVISDSIENREKCCNGVIKS